MPYDIALLNFYRPFRAPQWRGDFIKCSRRKSPRSNRGDLAVSPHAPPAPTIPHRPGQTEPRTRSVKPAGLGAAPRGFLCLSWDFLGELSGVWALGAFENLALDVSSTWRSHTRLGNCAPCGVSLCLATR